MSEPAPKLQAWGQLKTGSVYIRRAVDSEIEHQIASGKSFLVTASQQAGKSSLRVRLAQTLRTRHDFLVLSIDLSSNTATDRDWFRSLLREIWRQLETHHPDCQRESLDSFLESQPEGHWQQIWHRLILDLAKWSQAKKGLVLLFDEVQSELERRSFFAGLRAAHDELHERPGVLFAFCLFGVFATSGQMLSEGLQWVIKIPDLKHAKLPPFDRKDLAEFLPALTGVVKPPLDSNKLLDVVYDWTSGQPHLTHRILYELTRSGGIQSSSEKDLIRKIVEQCYLRKDRVEADFLAATEQKIRQARHTDTDARRIERALRLYRDILSDPGQKIGPSVGQPTDPTPISDGDDKTAHDELLLMGLCKVVGLNADRLIPANRITQTVFDQAWVNRTMTTLWFDDKYRAWRGTGSLPDTRSAAKLLKGEALQTASEWIKHQEGLTSEERDYILRSQRAQDRNELRQRFIVISFAVVIGVLATAITAVVSLYFYIQSVAKDRAFAELRLQAKDINQEDVIDNNKLRLMLAAEQETLRKLENELDKIKQGKQVSESEIRLKQLQLELENLKKNSIEAELNSQINALKIELAQLRSINQESDSAELRLNDRMEALPDRGTKTPLQFRHDDPVVTAALNSNGTRLFTGTNKGKLTFWDTANAVILKQQRCSESRVTDLAVSKDDRLVAFADEKGGICVFDTRGEVNLAKFQAHQNRVNALTFSSDGRLLLSGADDQIAKLWEAQAGKLLATQQSDSKVSAVAFSGNGRYLMVGDSNKHVHWIALNSNGTLNDVYTLKEHPGYISFLWMNEAATRALVGTQGGWLSEWNLDAASPKKNSRKQLNTNNTSNGKPPSKVEVRDTCDFLGEFYSLIIDEKGVTQIRKASAGTPAQALVHPRPEGAVKTWQQGKDNTARFSRDGSYVVTGSDDGYARLWRVKTKN